MIIRMRTTMMMMMVMLIMRSIMNIKRIVIMRKK